MTENARAATAGEAPAAIRSGRQWLEAVLAGEAAGPAPLIALGARLVDVGDGTAAFAFDPGAEHDNGLGMVHGGIVCTLIDAAAGCAVMSSLPPGRFAPSQDIRVSFLRPAIPDGGPVRVAGRLLNLSRRTALAEASLTAADGRLLAHGTLTCAVVEPERPPAGEEGR